MKQPGVYILQSSKNERYYIGSTNDVSRRIREHNIGKVIATKFIAPLELKVFIRCKSLEEARRAERRLKQYKSRIIIEKVLGDSTFPWKW